MGTEIKTWQIVNGKLAAIDTALKDQGRTVFYDAEHAFDGYKDEPEYALATWQAGNGRVAVLMVTPLGDDPAQLRYGVSVTDECVGWEETETLLRAAHAALAGV